MLIQLSIGLACLSLAKGRDLFDFRDALSRTTGSGTPAWETGDSPIGTYNWYKSYPQCGGYSQSPIALGNPDRVINVPKGENNYNIPKEMDLVNSNFLEFCIFEDFRAIIPDEIFFNTTQRYSLYKIHIIWGKDNYIGSDHSIDGVHYPMEFRFLFLNKKYKSVEEAGKHADGRIFNTHFIKVDKHAKPNPAFEDFLHTLSQVNGSSTPVPYQFIDRFPVWEWFRENEYYTYQGSLTFPPCLEGITYNVFITDFVISESQMDAVRYMRRPDGCLFGDMFRPIQPLNQRKVTYVTRKSHKTDRRKSHHKRSWERRRHHDNQRQHDDFDRFSSWEQDDHHDRFSSLRNDDLDRFSIWDEDDFDGHSHWDDGWDNRHGFSQDRYEEDDVYSYQRKSVRFPEMDRIRTDSGY